MKYLRAILAVLSFILIIAILYAIYVLLRPAGADPKPPVSGAPEQFKTIQQKGEYLARLGNCQTCHTSDDTKPFGGGDGFALPIGTIYSANISSDPEYGIGSWTDDEFVKAIREGVSKHVGHLYPSMPYSSYAGMSRDDVLAIKAYLMTTKPISEAAPKTELAFPFNQRWGMALWNIYFGANQRYKTDSKQSIEWNRGAYLTQTLGHCGMCHSPKNFAMGENYRKYLGGEMMHGYYAANITSDKVNGIGEWSHRQLTDYLKTGHAEGRSTSSGPMADVTQNSLQYLTEQDAASIATYLKTVKPIKGNVDQKINLTTPEMKVSTSIGPGELGNYVQDAQFQLGRQTFADQCAGCHAWNGKGRQTKYANLAGSRSVNDPKGPSLVQAIIDGTQISINGQTYTMPAFNHLSNAEIAALSNYVILHFGGKKGEVTEKIVKQHRS